MDVKSQSVWISYAIQSFRRTLGARALGHALDLGGEDGGRGRIRTDERAKRADLQSASFSHLDTLPAKEGGIID